MRHSRSARGILILALAATVLSACSSLPYKTRNPKSVVRELKQYQNLDGTIKPGRPKALSFCYSDMINTPQEVEEEARRKCRRGKLTYYGTDTFWTPCSVMQPARATFICTPTPKAGAESPKPN